MATLEFVPVSRQELLADDDCNLILGNLVVHQSGERALEDEEEEMANYKRDNFFPGLAKLKYEYRL